ncbi:phosphoribosyltransferase family protein [Streptomyces sp. NBC_01795]|uniref:phosphoribosyltransferase n=1 Tax=unclassified Streptomyces TaxID=2593676 RepID=UPI002DDC1354|nr:MULTISPECIES: phosphoribosyltransferase family protein [unclassified Streptomyces]WSA96030.1 phosphoribosyltransferase family protein [Streptomyces sp. NBC_01795]WSB80445.1 phosphoribosyltransferase family protein [Streptomyces sp. NBC_01775]
MRFRDRRQAGQDLAARLEEWAARTDVVDPLVLALPRGGVPVAVPVAQVLHAPLDVLVVRKIGVPGRPEAGIGAIAGEDPPLFDQQALEVLGLSEDRLAADVSRERAELRRREERYRRGRPAPAVKDRSVILVDDGLATGATARAALRHLRRQEPARLVLAVPVAAADTVARLRAEADDLLCLHQPAGFRAVGEWYENFEQVEDDEVIATLHGGPGSS